MTKFFTCIACCFAFAVLSTQPMVGRSDAAMIIQNNEAGNTVSIETGEGKAVINGHAYTGKTIVVTDGVVYIDGVAQSDGKPLSGLITVQINGNVKSMSMGSGTVTVHGDTGEITTQSGDVDAKNVSGNVSTMSGNITATSIHGSASSMSGNITH